MQVQQKAQDMRLPAAQQTLSRATAAIRSRVVDTVTGFLKNRRAQRSSQPGARGQTAVRTRLSPADATEAAASLPSMAHEGEPPSFGDSSYEATGCSSARTGTSGPGRHSALP